MWAARQLHVVTAATQRYGSLHSQLFASSPTGESVSRMQAEEGGANTLHGRLTLHIRHMPTEYAGLERAADINGDNDGNSTAGSIAVSSRRPCWQPARVGARWEMGEIEYSSVCCC